MRLPNESLEVVEEESHGIVELVPGPIGQPIPKRRFLKLMLWGLAGAGAGAAGARPLKVEATYVPGTPSDAVDTNLSVQGNLIVNQRVGIGTSTPQGTLDVAGEIDGAGITLVSPDGRGKQSRYSIGPAVLPLPATTAGTWGRTRTTTWNGLNGGSWDQASTIDGSWNRSLSSSWNQLLTESWGAVSAGASDQAPPDLGKWQRIATFTWGQLTSYSWGQLQNL